MRDINPSQQYIATLELIPREPNGITVKELLNKLDYKYPPSHPRSFVEEKAEIRKIQRVLNTLSERYPIAPSSGRAKSWHWLASAPVMIFPALDMNVALIFTLARKYLEPIIPEKTTKELANMFSRAEDRFTHQDKSKAGGTHGWRDKMAMAPTGIPRVLPRINSKIEAIVYEALLNEKAVKIKYQAWNKSESKEYVISPNGLYVRSQLIYLIVFNHDNDKQGHLLIHRIKSAEIVEDKFQKVSGFNAQKYVDEGNSHFFLDASIPKISLHIRLDNQPLPGVTESPISLDQTITQENEKWYSLTATVDNTLELRQWLRSHAHHIEVIAPKALRAEFKKSTGGLSLLYSE